jgi:hypothetical protein
MDLSEHLGEKNKLTNTHKRKGHLNSFEGWYGAKDEFRTLDKLTDPAPKTDRAIIYSIEDGSCQFTSLTQSPITERCPRQESGCKAMDLKSMD